MQHTLKERPEVEDMDSGNTDLQRKVMWVLSMILHTITPLEYVTGSGWCGVGRVPRPGHLTIKGDLSQQQGFVGWGKKSVGDG